MASTKSIKFFVRENKLASGHTAPYTARVLGYKTVGQEDIVYIMAGMNASVSRQENAVLTPGHTAVITGTDLDCDGNGDAEGLYLVDSASVLHKADVIHQQTKSRIVFQVPELVPGTYRLVLRRGFADELREGKLAAEISVN